MYCILYILYDKHNVSPEMFITVPDIFTLTFLSSEAHQDIPWTSNYTTEKSDMEISSMHEAMQLGKISDESFFFRLVAQ